MNGWMDGWMDGWMEWTNEIIQYIYIQDTVMTSTNLSEAFFSGRDFISFTACFIS